MNLQNPDKIKIIRIKNRLRLRTNDILINVKFNNLICQIQLAINTSITKFMDCSNKINHYIYQLERSRFGPILQMCSIWKNHEKKRSIQFSKIIQNQKKQQHYYRINNSSCIKNDVQHNLIPFQGPFICSQCSKHHYHNNFMTSHLYCSACCYFKCAICCIEENIKGKNIYFFHSTNQLNKCLEFPTPSNKIPKYGVFKKIQSKDNQLFIFIRVTFNNKKYVVIKNQDKFIIHSQITMLRQKNAFQKQNVIFSLPKQIVKKQSLFCKDIKQYLISNLFLPQFINKNIMDQRQSLSIIHCNMSKVQYEKIYAVVQVKSKMKFIKNIYFQKTKLCNLDFLNQMFINLRHLNLKRNYLEQISQISKFYMLQEINLSYNKIKNIKQQQLNKLHKLVQFNVNYNRIEKIPFLIQNLKVFSAKNNLITQFPTSLGKHKKLQILNLQRNKISKMPQQIQDLSSLKQLYLNFNMIKQFSVKIKNIINLKIIQIRGNGIEQIPLSLLSIKTIQNLNLGQNKIQNIPDSLSNLQNLQILSLQENQLIVLNSCIFKLQNLIKLSFNDNQIEQLSNSFDKLNKLTQISINNNKLKKIPSTILRYQFASTSKFNNNPYQQISLEFIDLFNHSQLLYSNQKKLKKITCAKVPEYKSKINRVEFRSNSLQQFPSFVFNFQNLQRLNLNSNKLKSIDDSFTSEMKFVELDIGSNQISILHLSLFKVTSIKNLIFENNLLTQIPHQISELINLQSLKIGKNKITFIPDSLKDLQRLQVLCIEDNEIQVIPDSIGSILSLRSLYAQNNKIKEIPLSLCDNKNIQFLNLKSNLIEKIPKQINKMVNLMDGYLTIEGNPIKQVGDDEFVAKKSSYWKAQIQRRKKQMTQNLVDIKDEINNNDNISPQN